MTPRSPSLCTPLTQLHSSQHKLIFPHHTIIGFLSKSMQCQNLCTSRSFWLLSELKKFKPEIVFPNYQSEFAFSAKAYILCYVCSFSGILGIRLYIYFYVRFSWRLLGRFPAPLIFGGTFWTDGRTQTNAVYISSFGGEVAQHSGLYEFQSLTLCREVSHRKLFAKIPSSINHITAFRILNFILRQKTFTFAIKCSLYMKSSFVLLGRSAA